MPALKCSKCGEEKKKWRGFKVFYQCTNPQCAKPICTNCAGGVSTGAVVSLDILGGLLGKGAAFKQGEIHPTAACPHCNAPVKFIG